MWAEIKYDIIDKITQKVFIAIYFNCLKEMHICWPVDYTRENIKK